LLFRISHFCITGNVPRAYARVWFLLWFILGCQTMKCWIVGLRNVDLETIWKEVILAWVRYYSGICLEELSKTTKYLSKYTSWDWASPVYKSRVLLLQQPAWYQSSIIGFNDITLELCFRTHWTKEYCIYIKIY
jgi:hypothetical protein